MTTYECAACGKSRQTWAARCPCGGWIRSRQSVVDASVPIAAPVVPSPSPLAAEISAITGVPVLPSTTPVTPPMSRPVPIGSVDCADDHMRVTSGIGAVDRVLGGGLVVGSLIVLGGDPGVGKSTLMAQILARAAAERVLYVTGEESIAQAAMRARRVGCVRDHVYIVAERDLDAILAHARALGPKLLAIDSIQTTTSGQLDGVAGSVSQVRHCTERLMAFAKATGITTILVGHVTKDGALAGPRTLEHLVDVVLHMWSDADAPDALRFLGCANKNRFGPTHERATFEIKGDGLTVVAEPDHGPPGADRDIDRADHEQQDQNLADPDGRSEVG